MPVKFENFGKTCMSTTSRAETPSSPEHLKCEKPISTSSHIPDSGPALKAMLYTSGACDNKGFATSNGVEQGEPGVTWPVCTLFAAFVTNLDIPSRSKRTGLLYRAFPLNL